MPKRRVWYMPYDDTTKTWLKPTVVSYQSRWWYIERPFPWPLIVSLLALVAVLVWVLW